MLIGEENAPSLPDVVIIDPASGYNVAIPATQQGYPNWWKYEPEKYEQFLSVRQRNGLDIDDALEAWEAAWDAR